ncbi:hypothetical protein QAD02_017554 [Eretmocerus hayati]|uniref:Uncharacterized protein n=1 Tax=Eretmocerus hayati TaxID=131215 RepID=A0ACC2PH63_9HYME|nr:hypothetical protein QAD02_017554 [Eretmocerus hayati]
MRNSADSTALQLSSPQPNTASTLSLPQGQTPKKNYTTTTTPYPPWELLTTPLPEDMEGITTITDSYNGVPIIREYKVIAPRFYRTNGESQKIGQLQPISPTSPKSVLESPDIKHRTY